MKKTTTYKITDISEIRSKLLELLDGIDYENFPIMIVREDVDMIDVSGYGEDAEYRSGLANVTYTLVCENVEPEHQ